jgi:hypothetical protein
MPRRNAPIDVVVFVVVPECGTKTRPVGGEAEAEEVEEVEGVEGVKLLEIS